jgi:hypothetical protein
VSSDFQIDDVDGTVNGLAHGAGFVLFIRDGKLDILEGFTYDEPWPKDIGHFRLTYHSEPRKLALPFAESDKDEDSRSRV